MSDNDSVRDKQIDSIIQRMSQCVDRIAELNAKMTIILEQQAQQTARLDKLESRLEAQISSMNTRISDLEKWLWRATGFAAAVLVAFELVKVVK